MKILHLIDSEGVYGAEVMLLNLASEQIKLGIAPTILNMRVSPSLNGSLEGSAIERGLKFRCFPINSGPDFYGILKVIRYAHANNYSLFHSHGYKSNILLTLVPKAIRKLPLITTVHGWTSFGSMGKLRFYEWLDKKSLNRADSIVAVSKTTAHQCHNANKQINVIYNGIPQIHFKATSNLQNQELVEFCQNNFTLGSIGRLSREKGYPILIEAFSAVAARDAKINLAIIGDGTERHSLNEKIRDLRLQDRVLLPGYLPDAAHYLQLFDIFLLSSLTEGMPITILEAMQARVPIVSTNVGGLSEIIKDNKTGILVDQSDAEALALAIWELHSDPDLGVKLADRAARVFPNVFSSRTMAEKYLEVYESVLT